MSLIQEALKRQQQEAEGKRQTPVQAVPPVQEPAMPPPAPAPKMAPPPPPVAPATPPAPAPEPPVKRSLKPQAPPPPPPPLPETVAAAAPATDSMAPHKALPQLAIMIGLIVILAGIAGAGIWFLVKQFTSPGVPTTTETPPVESTPVVAAPDPVTTPDPVAVTAPTTTIPPTPLVTPPVIPVTPVAVQAPRVVTVWPSISLSGIAGGGKTGSAILNGDIIGVGETISGVRLLEIRNRGVELEYKGERRFILVGGSTQ
ncbi:MAG: hypothetical protein A2498_05340 [Lentisphaerae bacterium RIFOXYC12_FULL_60_16]|nr:MAG: hypothetical protein A2498_05340 [Lentisphaerae bacterium RIFOXYC12_FULL_60_16]